MKPAALVLVLLSLLASTVEARVVRLRIERREPVLAGKAFGAAGPYEKLVGKADFALDPKRPQNLKIVDLALAPRNAQGEVEFSADFYMLKPVDPRRGNGRLFFEIGNRGGKSMMSTFQRAAGSLDPTTAEEFGDGDLMRQGFTMVWLGWQWDVPVEPNRMRMEMPIATDNGKVITGLVRGNFIGSSAPTASVADRRHQPYPVLDPASPENVMTVRALPLDPPQVVPRSKWRFVDPGTVTLDGGFELGKIYDVVYRTSNPKVVGVGLAGPRDLVSFLKHTQGDANPMPGLTKAISWGVSQTGRYQRHFLYEGFNEDEDGRIVFDAMFDQVGGGGRGSFNHRFAQASRDALHHFNILFPVDLFPYTDGPETDPETGVTDSLFARAVKSGTAPKMFHLLSNSEYYNRAGSLVHTNLTGTRDAEVPANVRIYAIASAPHGPGPFPPAPNRNAEQLGQTSLNPLNYSAVVRALFQALDEWVTDDVAPPPSRYPRIADGTLTAPTVAGWPAIPGVKLPTTPLTGLRLDFGPNWSRGIVDYEPPKVGKPFVNLVPAVDQDGNQRAGVRLPEISVPLATHAGWNYRHPSIGAPDRLSGEIGGYWAFPKTKAEAARTGDPRRSIEERYPNKEFYLGRITQEALQLVRDRYLLAEDVPEVIGRASAHYDWAVKPAPTSSEDASR
jgi:hypothetical protein